MPEPEPGAGAAPVARAAVVVNGREHDTAVYRREDFAPGDTVAGPAIVVQLDSTTLVEPGWPARSDPHGHLILARSSCRSPPPTSRSRPPPSPHSPTTWAR